MGKFTAKQLVWGIMLLALLVRLPELFISLAYDEIWTLTNFTQLPVSKLLFDLSLPNNHPVNTVLVKFMTCLPLPIEFIRLPNLLANIGSIVLAGLLTRRLAGQHGMLWSMFFMALNAPLAVYSVQARGYSLQIFFLLLFAFLLVKSYEETRSRRLLLLYNTGIVISALLSVMTLPTGILYLAGIVLILWNYADWKIFKRSTAAAAVLAGALALSYILLNYHDLQMARKWGFTIGSCREYLVWLSGILYGIVPGGLLLFCTYYTVKDHRHCVGHLLLFLLVFGSAVFTNGGAERVYLAWSVWFAVTAGAGCSLLYEKITRMQYRQLFVLLAILLAAATNFYQMRHWRFVDYLPVIRSAASVPAERLLIYPAGDGYALLWSSNGKVAGQFLSSIINASVLQEMFLINSPGRISGMDQQGNEKTLPLQCSVPVERFADVPVQKIRLERCEEPPPEPMETVLIFYAQDAYSSRTFRQKLYKLADAPGKILLLNNWFGGYIRSSENPAFAGVWYIAPGALNTSAWKNCLESFSGNITLYKCY